MIRAISLKSFCTLFITILCTICAYVPWILFCNIWDFDPFKTWVSFNEINLSFLFNQMTRLWAVSSKIQIPQNLFTINFKIKYRMIKNIRIHLLGENSYFDICCSSIWDHHKYLISHPIPKVPFLLSYIWICFCGCNVSK